MTLTDEEIRVKVAELMGYRWLEMDYCGKSACPLDARRRVRFTDAPAEAFRDFNNVKEIQAPEGLDPFEVDYIPEYTTDPAAALQLCDRMHSEGFECVMTLTLDGEWNVDFLRQGYKGEMISDPSLARAVTLCFLAAHSK